MVEYCFGSLPQHYLARIGVLPYGHDSHQRSTRLEVAEKMGTSRPGEAGEPWRRSTVRSDVGRPKKEGLLEGRNTKPHEHGEARQYINIINIELISFLDHQTPFSRFPPTTNGFPRFFAIEAPANLPNVILLKQLVAGGYSL